MNTSHSTDAYQNFQRDLLTREKMPSEYMIIRPSYCSLRKLRTAALRELHEETGYGSGKQGEGNAKIHKVSDILVKDPG